MSAQDTLDKPVQQAETPSTVISSKPRNKWTWLLAPLMAVSLVLHVGLLFVPLPAPETTEEDVEEEEVPEEEQEEEAIDILSLSEIATPEPPPEEPQEPQQQPQQQVPSPSSADAPPNLDPEQVSEPVEEVEPPVDDGSSNNFDPGAARNQFAGDLSGLGVEDYTQDIGLPESNFLRRPENASCFINSGTPVPGVRIAKWLDKEPQTLLRENLQNVYGSRGIAFEERPLYCGERYFYLYAADGNFFMAISLVQLEGSTLLIGWDTRPQ